MISLWQDYDRIMTEGSGDVSQNLKIKRNTLFVIKKTKKKKPNQQKMVEEFLVFLIFLFFYTNVLCLFKGSRWPSGEMLGL